MSYQQLLFANEVMFTEKEQLGATTSSSVAFIGFLFTMFTWNRRLVAKPSQVQCT